jgi:serine/threonine protein kinase
MGGEVSAQGDIYSYGILLLEMFTGKRPTDGMFTESFTLHTYAKRALPHHVMEIADPQILLEKENEQEKASQTKKGSNVRIEECCLSILRIGVSCSAEMQKERMDIEDVIIELNSIKDEFLQL